MSIFKRKPEGDTLEDWPTELAQPGRQVPPDYVNPDTLGIFDQLLWEGRGIGGGPEALFGAIDSEMTPETRAWLRHNPVIVEIAQLELDLKLPGPGHATD